MRSKELMQQIRAIEARVAVTRGEAGSSGSDSLSSSSARSSHSEMVSTGWVAVDRALCGAAHDRRDGIRVDDNRVGSNRDDSNDSDSSDNQFRDNHVEQRVGHPSRSVKTDIMMDDDTHGCLDGGHGRDVSKEIGHDLQPHHARSEGMTRLRPPSATDSSPVPTSTTSASTSTSTSRPASVSASGAVPVSMSMPQPLTDTQCGGGLVCGAIHEWYGLWDGDQPWPRSGHDRTVANTTNKTSSFRFNDRRVERPWSPPLSIVSHLAQRAWQQMQSAADLESSSTSTREQGWIVWIGRRCWPYPAMLESIRHRCVFIDVRDIHQRVWATDQALRCPGVIVVSDATGFDMTATRRLQLAAESGLRHTQRVGQPGMIGGFGLLVRPPREISQLSAAATRWMVRRFEPRPQNNINTQSDSQPVARCGWRRRCIPFMFGASRASVQNPISVTTTEAWRRDQWRPRWVIQLVRCKGVQPVPVSQRHAMEQTCRWVVEQNRAEGPGVVLSNVVGGSRETPTSQDQPQQSVSLVAATTTSDNRAGNDASTSSPGRSRKRTRRRHRGEFLIRSA